MDFLEMLVDHYGWQGFALAGVILTTLIVQLYYYLRVYSRIPRYRISNRRPLLDGTPPLSVVIPLFSEDTAFVEQTLPLLVAQEYGNFEVVIVYVGRDGDFFEGLQQLRRSFPNIKSTKIELDPRFPISPKMALNVGIKSSDNDHIVFTTPDAVPASTRWLGLMAKGFSYGDIVLGYCGMEHRPGFTNYLMRVERMMNSADYLAAAVAGQPYRGIRHNMGFTKAVYFGAKGFKHLNMNIGEDDLFLQHVFPGHRVAVVLSPRATLHQKIWGGVGWWLDSLRYYGSSWSLYPLRVRNFVQWERGSRLLFWASSICALALMPIEYKAAAGALVLLRLGAVLWTVRGVSRRLGERRMVRLYPLYDLFSPLFRLVFGVVRLRKDQRVWR